MKRIPRKFLIVTVILLVSIPLILFLIKMFALRPTQEQVAQKEYKQAKEQAQVLSESVAKQTEVPQDETPNVATITDVTHLQNQDFFKEAQNGDKILIYEKQKIIVLYRPNQDRVIATAPVLFNQKPENEASASADSTASSAATLPGVSL